MPTRNAQGELVFGGLLVSELARTTKTPFYAYDLDAIREGARDLERAFDKEPHLVCYAAKANTARPVLRALREEGCGADIVSGGELRVVLECGYAPESIIFSGVAKTDDEIDLALQSGPQGILAIQAESVEEIGRIAARARTLKKRARISLRINPALEKSDIQTHRHISTGHDEAKFGVPHADVGIALEKTQREELELVGLSAHSGSQLTETAGYVKAAVALFRFAREVHAKTKLRYVDTGGGFGIDYGAGCPATPADFVREVLAKKRDAGLGDVPLHVEPGRALVGAHGILVSRVIQDKTTPFGADPKDLSARRWRMIDAGMNDLIRPALYQAHHRIVPVTAPSASGEGDILGRGNATWPDFRVVGPVCESSDDFGPHPSPVETPSHLAILDAGAYGFTMAGTYNSRPLAEEIFLERGRVTRNS